MIVYIIILYVISPARHAQIDEDDKYERIRAVC